MALLGFSVMKEKLLDGSKTQTIRAPRKRLFKVGEKVYIYWHLRQKDCEKLGEGEITSVVRKSSANMSQKDALLDGFEDGICPFLKDKHWKGQSAFAYTNLARALRELHPGSNEFTEFDIVTWKWLNRKKSEVEES